MPYSKAHFESIPCVYDESNYFYFVREEPKTKQIDSIVQKIKR